MTMKRKSYEGQWLKNCKCGGDTIIVKVRRGTWRAACCRCPHRGEGAGTERNAAGNWNTTQ
jgi:hypothetical protein